MDHREVMLRLLDRAEAARTNQDAVVWTMVSIFAAAGAVLAQAVAQATVGDAKHPHFMTAFILSGAGLVLAVCGLALVDRG